MEKKQLVLIGNKMNVWILSNKVSNFKILELNPYMPIIQNWKQNGIGARNW
jgi:hypothetical protein